MLIARNCLLPTSWEGWPLSCKTKIMMTRHNSNNDDESSFQTMMMRHNSNKFLHLEHIVKDTSQIFLTQGKHSEILLYSGVPQKEEKKKILKDFPWILLFKPFSRICLISNNFLNVMFHILQLVTIKKKGIICTVNEWSLEAM